jgi:Copper type II ascorbate-dependent monooxygenase, C-terminal domain
MAAHQMLRIEAHYINAGTTDLMGQGSVTFRGSAKSSAAPWQPADLIFWGTTHIDIPPHSLGSVGPNFQVGIAGTHLISITTHQHELGTGIQAWSSTQVGEMGERITNDTDWASPSWRLLDTPIDFNGTNGLSYQCDWNNKTGAEVAFGESALNEMCFVGGYYYPSRGFDLCLDGDCKVRATGDAGAATD